MDVFVFGSNLAGRHGAGSALEAKMKWGAIVGKGVGRQGRSYAIPTKDKFLRTLPRDTIEGFVAVFLQHAADHMEDTFHVAAIGCGLAGYRPAQIAPFFLNATPNVKLPRVFDEVIEKWES